MKHIRAKWLWLFVIILIAGCRPGSTPSVGSTPTRPVPTATMEPRALEPTRAPEPTVSAQEPTPSADRLTASAPTPAAAQPGLQLAWTIQSGDILAIGAAADGKLYGYLNANPPMLVVLSNTGQVLQTAPGPDLQKCLRAEIKSWFVVRPEGTIVSTGYAPPVTACIFEPGDPPTATILEDEGGYLPYSTDPKAAVRWHNDSRPSGFVAMSGANLNRVYWNDSRSDFYNASGINQSTRQFFYLNQNGAVSIITFPEAVDVDKNVERQGFFFSVMPWDDVYVQYSSWDALGNLTGTGFFKAAPDGTTTPLAQMPPLVGRLEMPLVGFLPERNQFFLLNQGLSIDAYDISFKPLDTYPLPQEIKNADLDQLSIGHDLALYFFDPRHKVLSKYTLPGN